MQDKCLCKQNWLLRKKKRLGDRPCPLKFINMESLNLREQIPKIQEEKGRTSEDTSQVSSWSPRSEQGFESRTCGSSGGGGGGTVVQHL